MQVDCGGRNLCGSSGEKDQMKVLILANNDVGLYRFRKELIVELLKEHNVILSLPYGEMVEPLKALGCKYVDTPVDRRGINPIADGILFLNYLKLLWKERPEVVLTYTIKPNIYGGLVCRLTRTPYIINVTGLGTVLNKSGLLSKILKVLYCKNVQKSYHTFFQNGENLKIFEEEIKNVSNISLIPGSGVNLTSNCFEPYPEDDGSLRFMFVGRIMRDKGVSEYLECARSLTGKYSNIYFDVVGDYDDDSYRSVIKNLDNSGVIRYLGKRNDVHALMKSHHAIIHPSYHEGLSNVLLEAAACGRPVIATTVSGCRETYDDGVTGIGFEARCGQALIDAVEKFIQLPYEQKRAMGQAGRRKMEAEYDRNIVVDSYLEQINKIN